MSDEEENSIINMGIAVIFIAYSVFMFILGAWGNSILPDSCQNQTLRSSIRALIVTGAVSATAMIGYVACGIFCTRKKVEIIPNWFLVFLFALSIVNLSMAGKIQDELSANDPCYTGKSQTFKNMNSYGIMMSVVVLLISLAVLGYRGYNKFKTRKEKYIARRQKAVQEQTQEQAKQKEKSEEEIQSKELEKVRKEVEKLEKENKHIALLKEQQRALEIARKRKEELNKPGNANVANPNANSSFNLFRSQLGQQQI